MGKGRRKNTAKTGDKALYGQRSQPHQKSHPKSRYRGGGGDDGSDEDAMYDTVDRFHNRREKKQQEEFLRLDGNDYGGGDDGEESEGDNVEAVMDLGVGGSDDDGDDDDDDESSGSEGESAGGSTSSSASRDQTKEIDYDDDEEDDNSLEERDEEVEDVRDWGKRKSAYYHGDTADLEIGQEQDDAFLEEEAAKEIQRARMRELSEEDFALEDDGNGDVRGGSSAPAAPIGHPHRLSRREKGRLLDRQSPEFLPLVRHFADVARELHDRTDVAARALMEGEAGAAEAVGATPLGCEYLLTKALIETASALNLATYLLLKSEQPPPHRQEGASASLGSHPVLSQLRKLHNLSAQLEAVSDKVPGLSDQLDKLVQAAALMKGDLSIDDESGMDGRGEEKPEATGRSQDSDAECSDDRDENLGVASAAKVPDKAAPSRLDAAPSSSSSSDSDSDDEEARRKRVLDEARFALRPKEVEDGAVAIPRKRRPAPDFGEDVSGEQEFTGKKKAFAAALNSIQQRSAKPAKRSRLAEDLDDFMEREGDFTAGDDDREDFRLHGKGRQRDEASDEEYDEALDPELEEDGGGDFYSLVARKSKSRKEARKAMHKVAPKYPRVEQEIDGERALSRQILKNRGLVPHKNRLNRNPRVKKREQFRRALVRRRGAVREVRTDEGHKYGGEQTGIKTGLSRSRKLL